MQQPKLRSKVHGTDREIGEVTRIIVDPLSHDISHLVVSTNGRGGPEKQIESGHIQSVADDVVQLRLSSGEVEGLPGFVRDGYVSIHDIEIAHLEDRLHVESGEVLVPLPELERNVPRRNFSPSSPMSSVCSSACRWHGRSCAI